RRRRWDACSMIADTFNARAVSLWNQSGQPETVWGEERASPGAREELIGHSTVRRQATTASLGGDAGFAAALPLLARRSPHGALVLERQASFARRDLELLSIFSTKLALALENEELTNELRRTNTHLEAEVARQTEDLRRLSEQRRDLLGMVAHDVRGALTFVKLLADPQALASEGATDPVALGALEQIASRAGKTVDLLASLLDTQSIEEGKIEVRLQDVDLVARVKDLLLPLEKWAQGRNIALRLDATGAIVARTDPARFEQVIQNLISNAIKNTSKGTITTSIAVRDGRAHVRVSDTGRGIPAEVLAHIFKPVQTADSASGRPRVGLGLAIAHKIVTLLGGSIAVESAAGKGTTFSFDVPLSDPRPG
ncbi:MAG: sensor histidine kinase, partial [Planctomycetota bacterium]